MKTLRTINIAIAAAAIAMAPLSALQAQNNETTMKKVTAGRDAWDEFAPQFGALNDDVLFGQVWARQKQLAPRDRSMITIAAIFSSGQIGDAFKSHLKMGKANGITKEEIVEMITQLAFYCGWPKAWAALPMVKEVFNDAPDGNSHEPIFGKGEENTAYAAYFTGKSYLKPMVSPSEGNDVNIANVTFEPGCRNNWHSHTRKQILLVTDGKGIYQEWGKPARLLQKGDIVEIPVNVKHWHGAAADSYFTHIALTGDAGKVKNEWFEEVNDEQYKKANQEAASM